jgi:hypothetical protein
MFRLAQQQNISIASLMGLRPVSEPMSCNEISWWSVFRSVCPLGSEMMDINVQALTGTSIKWFDKLQDDEYLEDSVSDIREANRLRREKLKNG